MSLRTLWWCIKRPSPEEGQTLRAYYAGILPLAQRASGFHDQWLDLRNLAEDDQQLANAASVHRWETTRLVDELRAQTPPARARPIHGNLVACLNDFSHAFQLLATGTRYHRTEALCDGQALLVDCGARLQRVCQALSTSQPTSS